jgi:hypothetical protein
MLKSLFCAAALVGTVSLAACEEAGEDIDKAVDQATKGHEDKSDGAFEKTGEAIDKTVGAERKDSAADDLNDAIDGDKSTKPN